MKKVNILAKNFGIKFFTAPLKDGVRHFVRTASCIAILNFQLSTLTCFAQPQSRLWQVPPDQIKFPSLSVSNLPAPQPQTGFEYQGQVSQVANNVMHDIQGNVLFFIIDGSVYDKNGLLIGDIINPNTSGGKVRGISEWLIVPDPGNCKKYYLIGGNYDNPGSPGNDPQPYYIKLDLSILNYNYTGYNYNTNTNLVMGDFENNDPIATYLSGVTTIALHNGSLHFAVSPLRTVTNDRFLFISDAQNIMRLTISSSGISALPVILTQLSLLGGHNSAFQRNELELIRLPLPSGNYRIALGFETSSSGCKIYVGDINFNTGTIISERLLDLPFTIPPSGPIIPAFPHGLEFSPDGRFLYVAHTNANPAGPFLQYVDLNTSVTLVPLLPTVILSPSDFQLSQIELGYDGKLYFGAALRMARLNNPSNPVISTWTDNVTNLPGVPISDAGLSHSPVDELNIRLLNDQIDGEAYQQNYPPTTPPSECCIVNSGFTVNSYTATVSAQFPSTTQIWTPTNNPFGGTTSNLVSTVTIRNSLIIPPGFNITIQGMTFKFAPRTFNPSVAGAHVEVQRAASSTTGLGSRLTLTNTTFTSYDNCGNGMWEGVWVEGYNTICQSGGTACTTPSFSNSRMGWLRLVNNSVIENAYRGAVAARITNPFPAPPTIPSIAAGTTGGIIQAFNSRFRNNEVGVMLLYYDFPTASADNNASTFNNCFFETTLALNDPNLTKPFSQAFFWGVKGISFKGNDFITNETTSPYSALANNSGTGIYGVNSHFTVTALCLNPQCTSLDKNIFTNLTYGIVASIFATTKTVWIESADFKHNYRGILLNGVNFATVIKNNFEVLRFPTGFLAYAYGLYLNYARGFKVEENNFTYSGATFPLANSFGIIVNQSNALRSCLISDEIYRNKFHSILVGIQAQGNNSENLGCNYTGAPNNAGLVFKCNEFFSNVDYSDIRVVDFTSTILGNIAYQQGHCSGATGPAANLFSYTGNFSESDYAIQATCTTQNPTIIEYSHNDNTPQIAFPIVPKYYTSPAYSSACAGGKGVNLAECSANVYSFASCPSKLTSCPNCSRQAIAGFEKQIDSAKAILAAGDAPSLHNAINGNTSNGNLKNMLINVSPYLSDGVMTSYLQRTNTPPPGHISQVIVANSPVTSKVMNVLNGMSLPAGIKNEINDAQTGTSPRVQLENFISYTTAQRMQNIDDLLRVFLNDTTIDTGVDSVIAILKTYQIPESRCELAKAYLDKGDTAAARQVVEEAKNGSGYFCKLAEILLQLENVEKACIALPSRPDLSIRVDSIAKDTSSRECVEAQTLLKTVFGLIFSEIVIPVSEKEQLRTTSPELTQNNPEKIIRDIYPNPNTGTFSIDITMPETEQAVFELYNLLGKKQFEHILQSGKNILAIPEQQQAEGIYMYRIISNNKTIQQGKLVVIK